MKSDKAIITVTMPGQAAPGLCWEVRSENVQVTQEKGIVRVTDADGETSFEAHYESRLTVTATKINHEQVGKLHEALAEGGSMQFVKRIPKED